MVAQKAMAALRQYDSLNAMVLSVRARTRVGSAGRWGVSGRWAGCTPLKTFRSFRRLKGAFDEIRSVCNDVRVRIDFLCCVGAAGSAFDARAHRRALQNQD